MIISWFSCGITSAIATKLILGRYDDVHIVYINTGSEHPDSMRFLRDCETWFDHNIKVFSSSKYKNHFDVIENRRCINTPYGAPCTLELKKKVRWKVEDDFGQWDGQVFGYDISERKRAARFKEQNPSAKGIFPLIEKGLSKEDCLALVKRAGIELPTMYRLGFHNNNCIGCVKGAKGYWTKIKECFPEVYDRMAKLERKLGATCINGVYLDEMRPVKSPPLVESCSLFCDPEFMDI